MRKIFHRMRTYAVKHVMDIEELATAPTSENFIKKCSQLAAENRLFEILKETHLYKGSSRCI